MTLSKLIISGAILGAFALSASAEQLVILHTNDTHSQIDPLDDGLGGVSRRKVLIDSVRSVNENVLLIDAGDIVQGTLFFNIYKGEVEEKVMNALGYDIRILGNHEFDNGLEGLADNLKNADATLLAANYQMRGTPLEGLFEPYLIKEIEGKRIAFLPVNLEPEGMIAGANYEGMGYLDAIETANNEAWFLKNVLQADMVIALTHIGYNTKNKVNDQDLAKASKDIDVIIGGHTHTLVNPQDTTRYNYKLANADGREILVAQAGSKGAYLGQITIDLDNLNQMPDYRLIRVDSRLDDRIDPDFEAIIQPYRAKVDSLNSNNITRTAREFKRDAYGLINYMSDLVTYRGRQLADNIDLGILNRGGLRNDLPKGDITEGQLITLMPFFNRVQVIDITGENLLKTFDVMAASGGNGVSKEVEIVFDPVTGKCTDVKISGKEVDPKRVYRVATIDYLANGGDYMEPLTHHTLVASSPNYLYEDVLDYFSTGPGKGKKIDAKDTPRMRANNR